MSVKAIPDIKNYLEKDTTGTQMTNEIEPEPEPERKTVKEQLVVYLNKFSYRMVLLLSILFIILVALSVNALVQSIFQGLSPDKEYNSIVLLIISNFLYMLVVATLLIGALLLVAYQEVKRSKNKKQDAPSG